MVQRFSIVDVPFLCRIGIHWRDWTATVRLVAVVPQARLPWFNQNTKTLEAKLHTRSGKCKRCSDLLTYYTVYEVEEGL